MPALPASPLYLTTGQAAQRIGMSRFTLLRAVKSGAISPALRTPGGRLRFAPATVDRFARHLATVAHHDALTGAPNRTLFLDRFQQALLAAHRDHAAVSVLLVDVCRLEDQHSPDDRADANRHLREVANLLRGLIRASDTVARYGLEKFAILLPCTDEAGAIRVANTIRPALEKAELPRTGTSGHAASIGIAVYPDHGRSTRTLLHAADRAIAVAKDGGGGYAVFAPGAESDAPSRQSLAGDLRPGIAAGQLRLHYQPVVACPGGQVLYAEALVRWAHPRHGLLLPHRFIPLAEQSGAITVLTLWVLEEALQQCRTWKLQGCPLGVAVNLSMVTVQESQFPDLVQALLRHYDMPPHYLTFEITESTLMEQPEQALAVLDSLASLGVRLAIDDFGIGHSSLAQLRDLPVHNLKVDRSFVRDAVTARDAAMLTFILRLGNALGLTVVVEGVESQKTWDWLVDLGCEAVQGFRVARPVPADEFDRWRLAQMSDAGERRTAPAAR